MRQLFSYGILFRNGDLECGFFSVTIDIFAGDTEENVNCTLECLCEKQGWDVTKVKKFSIARVQPNFLRQVIGDCLENRVSRPGNDGSKPRDESDRGSGDGPGSFRLNLDE